MLSLYDGAVQEAQFLHAREAGNAQRSADALFFSIFRKTGGRPVQRSYRMPQLERVVLATHGQDDVYLSQSTFFAFGRKAVNFKQTRAAWVDLDIYNQGRTLDGAMVNQIIAHAQTIGIPVPTSIISSGRGCYLKWFFQTPVTQQQLPVWNLLQSTLTAAFSGLAADFKSRDIARVFRLIDSKNSKSGEKVAVVEGSGVLHDFAGFCASVEALRADLITQVAPSRAISTLKRLVRPLASLTLGVERGNADALALYAEMNQPIMMKSMSIQSLNWMRFCDLRDVYASRGGIPVGERDQAMFWMLNFLSQAGVVRAQNWNAEIVELLKAFPAGTTFDPLNDGSMNTLLNRLKDKEAGRKIVWRGREIDPLYRPSNEFLIETFAIKNEEMSGLSTIISPLEKRSRVDAKNEGRDERRSQRVQWRQEVLEVFNASKQTSEEAQGKTLKISSLARYLGVERTRISRYWLQLSNSDKAVFRSNKPCKAMPLICVKSDPVPPPVIALSIDQARTVAKQAQLAEMHARKAQKAADAMALERKMLDVRNAWARRKLAALTHIQSDSSSEASLQDESISPRYSTLNGDDPMSTESLRKRMALYQAASEKKPATSGVIKASAPSASGAASIDPSSSPELSELPGTTQSGIDDPTVEAHAASDVQALASSSGEEPTNQQASTPVTSNIRQRLAAASSAKNLRQEALKSAPKVPEPLKPGDKLEYEIGRPLVDEGPRVPRNYPAADVWPSDAIPPGSRYSAAEWAAARTDEQGRAYGVVEMQTGTSSWLAQYLKPEIVETRRVVNGKVVEATERKYPADFQEPGMCEMLGQLFDGCIWLSPRAVNTFPGSAEASVTLTDLPYAVVRSRLDYTDPDRYFKVGTTVTFKFDLDAYMDRQQADAVEKSNASSDAPGC